MKPIKKFSLGKINSTVFEGDYQGKPTYSVAFQKSYKDKNDEWKNTNFFNLTELRDLYALVGYMLNKQVKEKAIQQKKQDDLDKKSIESDWDNITTNSNEEVPF